MTCTKFITNGYSGQEGIKIPALCRSKFKGFAQGTRFEINRPSFIAGTEKTYNIKADNIDGLNQRHGTGNREIIRPSFKAPPVKARQVDFEQLQALPIDQAGTFSERALNQLFEVETPDSLDVKWLERKKEMIKELKKIQPPLSDSEIARELSVNKPLGRDQRTVTDRSNIGSSRQTLAAKLNEIKEEVDSGKVQTVNQQAVLVGQLAAILNNTQGVLNMTRGQLTGLGKTLDKMGIQMDSERLGLPHRYVDKTYYSAHQGLINLLILSRVSQQVNTTQFNYDIPVKNFAQKQFGLPAMSIASMVTGLGRPGGKRLYLDLVDGGVISRIQLRDEAEKLKNKTRTNGFKSNLFNIQKENR